MIDPHYFHLHLQRILFIFSYLQRILLIFTREHLGKHLVGSSLIHVPSRRRQMSSQMRSQAPSPDAVKIRRILHAYNKEDPVMYLQPNLT